MIAKTPKPPYFAVIFSSVLNETHEGYQEMADEMIKQAEAQPGFLGIESARNDLGISVSYWSDEASIKNWKEQLRHQLAQKYGREKWYKSFMTRVAKVERDYGFGNI